ncbi:MAG: MarC family protein [Puniceicoccales bacterium]|nr:MarC family protein [Puniceicoccales bacterium]
MNAFKSLWAAINPVAMSVVFSSLVGYHAGKLQTKMIYNGSIVAFFLVLIFTFCGPEILNFLGINLAAIEFSSGFALVFIALAALRSSSRRGKISEQNFGIIPLAMPLLGSPATLICGMSLFTNASGVAQKLSIVMALACVISLTCVLLILFARFIRAAGETVTSLFFRLSGLLTFAIGAQYVFSGIAHMTPAGFFH